MRVARKLQVNFRMSIEESRRLSALAEHYGLSAADWFRMTLKKESDRLNVGSADRRTVR